MVSMRLNLADPDKELSDEQLEVIMKEFLVNVLEKKALVRQKLAAAKEEAAASARRLKGFAEAQSPTSDSGRRRVAPLSSYQNEDRR